MRSYWSRAGPRSNVTDTLINEVLTQGEHPVDVKVAICKPREQPGTHSFFTGLRRSQFYQHVDLRRPASKLWDNKLLLLDRTHSAVLCSMSSSK